jgi:stage II sporulation protein P
MYKSNKDETLIKIVFFIIGLIMMFRILIPIIYPVSVATDTKIREIAFFQQILNKSNAAIESTQDTIEDEDKKDLFSIVFKYISGVDLSNPKSLIASQVPILGLLDIISMSENGDGPGPVVVVPKEEIDNNKESTENNPESGDESEENHIEPGEPSPGTGQPSGTPQVVTPGATQPVARKRLDQSKPLILIYHTHTTENYNAAGKKGENFSTNFNIGICKVGAELEKELESKYGIATIHDTTVHDVPRREGAYEKSRPTVQKYLKKYPSLQVVIDLHRDGDVGEKGTAIINNERYARVAFVLGTGHKNYDKNAKLAQKLKDTFDLDYPGFSRGIIYASKNRYNQDLSAKIALIEVGSNNNSLQEAVNTSKLIAKVLAKNIK